MYFQFFLIPFPASGAEQAFTLLRVGDSQPLTWFFPGFLQLENDTQVFCRLHKTPLYRVSAPRLTELEEPHCFSRQPGLCSRPLGNVFIHRFAMNNPLFTWPKPDNKPNRSDYSLNSLATPGRRKGRIPVLQKTSLNNPLSFPTGSSPLMDALMTADKGQRYFYSLRNCSK